MGYLYVPDPVSPKPAVHICPIPYATEVPPGTVWQCEQCGTKYVYRASASCLVSLLFFIALPIGMLYLAFTGGRAGWAKKGLVNFFFALLASYLVALVIFIFWVLAASQKYSSIGHGAA